MQIAWINFGFLRILYLKVFEPKKLKRRPQELPCYFIAMASAGLRIGMEIEHIKQAILVSWQKITRCVAIADSTFLESKIKT